MSAFVLELDHVSIAAPAADGPRLLVEDCTLQVRAGEALGLVGESGSGKTLSARAVAGLLPDGFDVGGAIRIDGEDIATLPARRLRDIRARRLGMVFQTPRAHLNPLRSIGDFMTEALITVAGERPDAAERRAIELLAEVGIPDPDRRMKQRPGDLSGGLLQRVMIAATLAMDPPILLADEITTALDVTTQEEVMAVIADLRRHRDLAMLFITHDLALAGAVCDRIAVMQNGRTVETLRASTMRQDAVEPYTRRLLSATLPADLMTDGVAPAEPVLVVEALRKTFQVRSPKGGREEFIAVDGVGFTLAPGGSLGIVGESGSGKSTTARIICGLETTDDGTVTVKGEDWTTAARGTSARRRRARIAQMVFQDPYQSLDRRQTVRACLREAVAVHRPKDSRGELDARVDELLAAVRLDGGLADRKPRSLSGGQRQRVAIARALAADPEILVLDEAVSALDVTTQVEILTLLDGIRRDTGVALLMISHDLTVVRRLCDHVVVMRSGVIVEQGSIADVLDAPRAEYTRMLLDSIPHDGWVPRRRVPARTTALPTVATTNTRIVPPGGDT
ncbi:peptide/nickel transport system ATP-binding protein [Microbacterium sp. cf046]|uniref:nickel ABC transporter ATP-binding protein NikE n=1 Tax=Microbacterium sp. cf046 TaxID=1761803 RepID=UPI0008F17A03|nr:ABC transporter ATP-binding protein [Microbacterium sp. cf046]SFS14221.1 peptide/nickel transport system ATP-binding protein [Microbacterium sp. cf046]